MATLVVATGYCTEDGCPGPRPPAVGLSWQCPFSLGLVDKARIDTMSALWLLVSLQLWAMVWSSSQPTTTCSRQVVPARAEQVDGHGRRCWDTVRVASCKGRCDSREISDWQFPFKLAHHPVCSFRSRRPLMVRLRHCEPGVEPGTELFHYVAAEDCRCKICMSEHTSCEWLPPNSTLLEGFSVDER